MFACIFLGCQVRLDDKIISALGSQLSGGIEMRLQKISFLHEDTVQLWINS